MGDKIKKLIESRRYGSCPIRPVSETSGMLGSSPRRRTCRLRVSVRRGDGWARLRPPAEPFLLGTRYPASPSRTCIRPAAPSGAESGRSLRLDPFFAPWLGELPTVFVTGVGPRAELDRESLSFVLSIAGLRARAAWPASRASMACSRASISVIPHFLCREQLEHQETQSPEQPQLARHHRKRRKASLARGATAGTSSSHRSTITACFRALAQGRMRMAQWNQTGAADSQNILLSAAPM